ncbi:uncharacterized protein LOC106871797 [Octopus bimaculoides]|uniref:uncharacterized protein LOC106871797 n=1 Tax=Octopus bimaculoides TaxID=37653 RepID=UPI00071CE701|nr:uncharacterized protein LOC106871797 [Octopus bimaculoides]|eukprot:XP_014773929.1 PREDICTED: uncharacterized protein LOC106871797 [Octopus bimaculoides]
MPSCNITKSSDQGQVLQMCHLIVWDECTMAHKRALETLDRALKDIRDCHAPMRGVTLLLLGDFGQTLPVIPKGTRADEVQACLQTSTLWHHVTILSLNTNMRAQLHGDQMSKKFAQDILTIGDGKVPLDAAGEMEMSKRRIKSLTMEEILTTLEEVMEEEDVESADAVIIPPEADAQTDNEDIDDDCTGNADIEDVAGSFELHVAAQIVSEEVIENTTGEYVANYPEIGVETMHLPKKKTMQFSTNMAV